MTLAELIQEVYTLTGRPDRVAETLSAIKAATLKMHQLDYFPKDLFESGLAFDTPSYVQNFEYRVTVPRFRALKYLRKLNNGTPGKFLSVITPEQVLDSYSIQRQDICYVAGQFIQINSSTEQQEYLIGCYVNPDVGTATFDSWVAVDHPFAIIFEAAAGVFKAVGKDEEHAAYRSLVQEQIQTIRATNTVAVGF